MANYTDVALCAPFKCYKNNNPGDGMDGDFFVKQIASFETMVCYKQKWQRGDSTKLQLVSSIAPNDANNGYYKPDGTKVADMLWVDMGTITVGVKVWEALIDFNTIPGGGTLLPDGTYHLFFAGSILGSGFEYVTEPIQMAEKWPNTKLWTYWHRYNDFGVIWATNVKFSFRVESRLMDFQPESERAVLVDETHDVKTQSATPWRSYKLYVGNERGVPPWVADIMARIYCCTHVESGGIAYQRVEGAKWSPTREKNYPMHGWAVDITEAVNNYTNQTNSGFGDSGFVTAYDLQTNFFGRIVNTVHVLTYEQAP